MLFKLLRQLANTDAKYLYDKLIRECAESAIEPPSLKSVKTWIMVARNFSIDEIVNEIIGTDENTTLGKREYTPGILEMTAIYQLYTRKIADNLLGIQKVWYMSGIH